jgi:hypothetical protein
MAAAAVAAMLVITPWPVLKKLLGYSVVADISGSAYLVSTYAATGTVSGLAVAIFGALLLTLTLRTLRQTAGYSRFSINGSERLADLVAAVLNQAIAWLKRLLKALFTASRVVPPPPIDGRWVDHGPDWPLPIRW